jgi:hypothetical protein
MDYLRWTFPPHITPKSLALCVNTSPVLAIFSFAQNIAAAWPQMCILFFRQFVAALYCCTARKFTGAKERAMPEFFEVNFREYRQYIDLQQNSKAIDAALELLSKRKKENASQYSLDHKGSPFYVLGYAAFASHDYPSASLYFDAAVAADLRYHKGDMNKPALRFMQLLHTNGEDLLARDIIALTAASAEQLLNDYRARPDAQAITLDELRDRFLRKILTSGLPEQRALVTAFISFVAEWPYRTKQMELIEEGSREPFFLHILRGCVLFESLLKAAPDGARELVGISCGAVSGQLMVSDQATRSIG